MYVFKSALAAARWNVSNNMATVVDVPVRRRAATGSGFVSTDMFGVDGFGSALARRQGSRLITAMLDDECYLYR